MSIALKFKQRTTVYSMQAIKVGMTRRDLLTVFMPEGGISTRLFRRYVFRGCQYIKVDVEFTPVGTRPYLAWSVTD